MPRSSSRITIRPPAADLPEFLVMVRPNYRYGMRKQYFINSQDDVRQFTLLKDDDKGSLDRAPANRAADIKIVIPAPKEDGTPGRMTTHITPPLEITFAPSEFLPNGGIDPDVTSSGVRVKFVDFSLMPNAHPYRTTTTPFPIDHSQSFTLESFLDPSRRIQYQVLVTRLPDTVIGAGTKFVQVVANYDIDFLP